jgi:type II restriction enzyme
MDVNSSKEILDSVIKGTRVHFYKPIQIAEILYKARINSELDLNNIEEYRTKSKKWRDNICGRFIGRNSSSSAEFQDAIFKEGKMTPEVLVALSLENNIKNAIVENYIYNKFFVKHGQMSTALSMCNVEEYKKFNLLEFLNSFESKAGLKRSLDKIYEIVVYSLFSAILEALELTVKLNVNPERLDILDYFKDFSENILMLTKENITSFSNAKINRVGVTNACDRGLDMWSNFGVAIQIKHLTLTEELAEDIISTVTGDRVVIVCKEAEKELIVSLLGQIGWKARIQSIITEDNLITWFDLAINGLYDELIGKKIISYMKNEIEAEFPSTDLQEKNDFYAERGYTDNILDVLWKN